MAKTFLCFLLFVPTAAICQQPRQNQPEITFLSALEGAKKIAGEEDDPFFAKLHLREAATMTGVANGDQALPEARKFAREFFRAAVLDFNDQERDAVKLHLDRVVAAFGDAYPLLVRRPWRLLKTRKDLCGGFSFTRGDTIVLSESTLARFVKAANSEPLETKNGEALLLHEQMHVLQRAHPELFVPLYECVFHFRHAHVNVHPWISERQVTNPDGISNDWIAVTAGDAGQDTAHWIGTVLLTDKPVHTMGRDFSSVAVPVTKNGADYEMIADENGKPRFESLDQLTQFTSRLPIRGGYDHPNEVAAYLFTVITHGSPDRHLNGPAAEVLQQAKDWFAQNLKSVRQQQEELLP